jgi:hypothetical protein
LNLNLRLEESTAKTAACEIILLRRQSVILDDDESRENMMAFFDKKLDLDIQESLIVCVIAIRLREGVGLAMIPT